MHYQLISEQHPSSSRYGIAVYAAPEDENPLLTFPDLSDSRTSVDRLLSALCAYSPSPCHLPEIIEDYLTDFTI